LGSRDLLLDRCLCQPRYLLLQECPHTLLIAADSASQALGILVAEGLGQGLDSGIGGDLLRLAGVLRLCILELLLLLTGSPQGMQWALSECDRFLGSAQDCLGGLGDRLRSWGRHRLGSAAQRFDALLDFASMMIRSRSIKVLWSEYPVACQTNSRGRCSTV